MQAQSQTTRDNFILWKDKAQFLFYANTITDTRLQDTIFSMERQFTKKIQKQAQSQLTIYNIFSQNQHNHRLQETNFFL
jgi:hypothetical protein